ncbi:MAG: PAS domain-containing protein, partial [Planctomycetota bacterium]
SEERYRQLIEHIPDAFCLQETGVDEQGKPCDNRILAVNPAFERLMGMSRQDMVGRRVRELFPSIEDYWVTTFGQVALSGMSTVLEDFSDVGERWYRISAYCPRRGQFAAFISDVTEEHRQAEARRQLDQQIQQTQRLESLGLLAGGVAHDFNNILMAIVGHAELLSNRLPAETPGREHLEHIYNAAQRAAELCKQMLAYAGKSSHIKEAIDLGALVREMVGFITTAIKSQARLELAIDDDLPTVNVDPSQIRQVLMNLIMNASDALPDSNGLIKVSLSRNDCSAAYVASTELHGDLEPGAYLCLAVSDNGCGIDPEVRKRIFEPFYTTKSQGRGLGLAAILGIARAHSGGMRLSSEVGRGSTFELLLPLEQQPSPSMGEHGPAAGPSLHSGGVLLINTEADFGQVGEAMLRSLGYQVMLASDLPQALQLYQQQRSNIDALVVGRCVDGVAGITLLQDLREQGVASPCVLVSADDEEDADDMAPLLRQLGVVAVLPKPCTVLELRAAMRRISGDQRSF